MMRIRPILWTLLLLPATASRIEAQVPTPPRLLLLDIEPHGVAPEVTRSLTDLLELEIERGRLYTVISQQDLRTLIRVEEQKLLLGKDEESNRRLAEIAGKVDAPWLLGASLGKVGRAYLLSLELMDTGRVEVVHRVSQTLVGRPEELVGSLRTAALALTLEDKGLTPDISARLIDEMKIGEKPKTLFLTLGPEIEVPVGRKASGEDVIVYDPIFYHLRLDAELPLWPWLRLVGSVSLGFTINADEVFQGLHGGRLDDVSRIESTSILSAYRGLRVPLLVGFKLSPDFGRFLPFAMVGAGASWQSYVPRNAAFQALKYEQGQGCANQEPFVTDPEGEGCLLEMELQKRGDVSAIGLDAVAVAGFEWLLSHHFGLQARVGYHFTWLPGSDDDLHVAFEGTKEGGTPPDDWTYSAGYLFAVQKFRHALVFSTSAIVYW